MGVNTQLFVSSDWDSEDIIEVVKSLAVENSATVIPTHTPNYFLIEFQYQGETQQEPRRLSVFLNYEQFGFRGTLLDVNAWGSSVEIMTKIAGRFGGVLVPNDCFAEATVFGGTIQRSNDLVFWTEKAAVEGKRFKTGAELDVFIAEHKARMGWKE